MNKLIILLLISLNVNSQTIEAEDYVYSWDGTVANIGGAYKNDAVDIRNSQDSGNAVCVGWITNGEWLGYNVEIFETGSYDFDARISSPNSNCSILLFIDNSTVPFLLKVPQTGGFNTWKTTEPEKISLTYGLHYFRLLFVTSDSVDANKGFDFNWWRLNYVTPINEPVDVKKTELIIDSVGTYSNKIYKARKKVYWKTSWLKAGNDSMLVIKSPNYDTVWCKEIIYWYHTNNDLITPVKRMEVTFLTTMWVAGDRYNDVQKKVYFANGKTPVDILWIKQMDNTWTLNKLIED